jgi:tyrosyl-tRNA synthetase
VPKAELLKADLANGIDMIAALSAKTNFLASNGEARRALKENSISVNKEKVTEDYQLSSDDLINDRYIIINKGKKNTYIIKVI